CDLIIAADTARFIEIFVRRGLLPDAGGSYLLTRLVGPLKAKELLFFGDDIAAPEAQRLGLVNRVVPAASLREAAGEWATRLAAGPTVALSLTKRLVNAAIESDRTQAFRAEALAVEVNMQSVDGQDGVSALGASEAGSRVRALDKMHIHRQLLFPNTTLRELRIHTGAAQDACRRYNDYVIDWTRQADDRARAVCQINMTDRDWALTELRRVIDCGARGVLLPCAEPPAGTSPASPVWDDFWRALEEADTPALIHIGAGGLASAGDDDPM